MFKPVDYFKGHKRVLSAELELIRAKLEHTGNKGALAEIAFRRFLAAHMPRSMDIGHGEVVDLQGQRAGDLKGPGQIDVLIIGDEHPRFSNFDDPALYFIEGVLCGAEVKTEVQSKHLDDVVKKAAKFKRLKPDNTGVQLSSNEVKVKRYVERRAYFLFAFSSQLEMKTLLKRINESFMNQKVDPSEFIDAVFTLDRGSAILTEDHRDRSIVAGQKAPPKRDWEIYEDDNTLLQMITWLHLAVPRLTYTQSFLPGYLVKT